MTEESKAKSSGLHSGISRRGFLSSVSAGAVVAVSLKEVPVADAQEVGNSGVH